MKRVFQYIAALLVIFLLVWMVDTRELATALKQMTLEVAGMLLLISFVLIYISALKWKLFLKRLGSEQSVWRLCEYYLLGYFVNLVLPSYLGGDAVRSWFAGKRTGQHEAAASTILERYTGLMAMIVLGLGMMWLSPQVTPPMKYALGVVALFAVVGTLVALSDRVVQLLSKMPFVGKLAAPVRKVQAALRIAGKDPMLMTKAMLLSFLFHSVAVANTVAAACAVGWYTVPVLDLFVVVPLILLIGALPIAPSGLGIQEGAFYFFLHGLGATPAQALGVGLVLRAKSYVLAVFGGVSFFRLRGSTVEVPLTEGQHPSQEELL